MKIDEATINHNAVRLIAELTEVNYELIDEKKSQEEREFALMTLGEISGICAMADALKEVLNT